MSQNFTFEGKHFEVKVGEKFKDSKDDLVKVPVTVVCNQNEVTGQINVIQKTVNKDMLVEACPDLNNMTGEQMASLLAEIRNK